MQANFANQCLPDAYPKAKASEKFRQPFDLIGWRTRTRTLDPLIKSVKLVHFASGCAFPKPLAVAHRSILNHRHLGVIVRRLTGNAR